MHEVLVALIVVSTVSCAVFLAGLLWVRHQMRRHLQVRPGTRSAAPTRWALSTSEPARLHRRLRRVAAAARLAGTHGDATTSSLAAQVEDEAMRLETNLVALSRVWRVERTARREMTAQVKQLEQLTVRVAATAAASTPALGVGSHDNLAELQERLDALDAARKELSAVEQQAGLRFG